MKNTPVKQSDMDILLAEIKQLRERVKLLENQHSPTVPVYRPDFPVDPIQGQIALADNSSSALALFWRVVSGWLGPLLSFSFANVGDWLSVETTTAGAPFGGGVNFNVGAGDFNVFALDGQVYIDGDAVSIFSENFDMSFDAQKEIQILSRGPGANLWSFAGALAIVVDNGFDITIGPGTGLTVHDSVGGDVFRVDEDGDVHIKTGKTITADL